MNSRYYSFVLEGRSETINLPSVTTILQALAKPALVSWAWNMALKGVSSLPELPEDLNEDSLNETLKRAGLGLSDSQQKAMSRGTEAHKVLEALARGEEPPDPEDPFTQGLMGFWEAAKPEVTASEQVVWSLRNGYAGTADLITQDAVIDLKTRAAKTAKGYMTKAYEADFLQVAAYRLAWGQMGNRMPPKTQVLVVRDDSSWTTYEGHPEQDTEAFLQVLKVWEWLQEAR